MAAERDPQTLLSTLSDWLEERVRTAGAAGVAFGLSGGIDSAVACGLAARALGPERCLAIIMPIGNLPEDEQLAHRVAAVFGVRTILPDLMPAFGALESALGTEREAARLEATDESAALLASANLKPRLRMLTLYYFANLLGYLVMGTGNRAELTVGYFTKYGDAGVDLLPLGDLTKGEVRALARELEVPEQVIDRPPSAGLWAGQTDEEELGITYQQIDRFILEGSSGDPEVDRQIQERFAASQHKREPPPIADPK